MIRVIGSYSNTKEDEIFEEKIKAKQQEMVALIAENAQSGTYTEEFDRCYQAISEEIKIQFQSGIVMEQKLKEEW